MVMSGITQPHTAQRTGRLSLAFSPVAVPACLVASLPQLLDKDAVRETVKRSWQEGQTGPNFGRLAGIYSGCEKEISPSSESPASAPPRQTR